MTLPNGKITSFRRPIFSGLSAAIFLAGLPPVYYWECDYWQVSPVFLLNPFLYTCIWLLLWSGVGITALVRRERYWLLPFVLFGLLMGALYAADLNDNIRDFMRRQPHSRARDAGRRQVYSMIKR